MKIISTQFAAVPASCWVVPERYQPADMRAFNKRQAHRSERRQIKRMVKSLDETSLKQQFVKQPKVRSHACGYGIGSAAFMRFMERTLSPKPSMGIDIDAAAPMNSSIKRVVLTTTRKVGNEVIREDVCIAACC